MSLLESLTLAIAVVILVSGSGFILYNVIVSYTVSTAIGLYGYDPFRYVEFFPRRLRPEYEVILKRTFSYYNHLSPGMKKIFRHRLQRFISSKIFEARGGLTLKEEMIVIISASAIQLTFGLSEYTFPHFKRILIYPGTYYSRFDKLYHKGEVNAGGVVVFSWIDFIDGYRDPADNINLGLHEFAHALFVSFQKPGYNDQVLERYYRQWREIGDAEFFRQRKGSGSFFREYAQTNLMEFFAVSVEYFFESPHAFRKELPELYIVLSKLLGQDPAQILRQSETS